MEAGMNRRALLKRGVALAGGLTLTFGTTLAAFAGSDEMRPAGQNGTGRTHTFFALATTRSDQDAACTRHAANKLFASPESADRNRAHPGCKCQVVKGGELPEAVWNQLFGAADALQRVAVDRRWGWVAQTLKA